MISKFEKQQRIKEQLLTEMLNRFNEGRSKSHYCIIATVFTTDEITMMIKRAKISTNDIKDKKQKSNIFHSIAADIAEKKGYELKLRKYRQ